MSKPSKIRQIGPIRPIRQRYCLCNKGFKEGRAIVCYSCWRALPSLLRTAWYNAETTPERRAAARKILKWVMENRRAK